MANVTIIPVPDWCRRYSQRLWPCHPPIFSGEPTEDDRELARELIAALDDQSREWYRSAYERLLAE